MWTISGVKEKGRNAFKANYGNSVLAGIIAVLFAGGTAASAKYTQGQSQVDTSSLTSLTPEEIAFGFAAVLGIFVVAMAITILVKIFLLNPLYVGSLRFFRLNAENPGTELSAIKEGFSDYGRVFVTIFLKDLFLTLWCLLCVVPGLIKVYSYRMVPFILKDNPELSAMEVITKSREMMNGNKWRAFLLDLSFIGWILLECITCGLVGIFWTNPYMYNTNAALYLELKNNSNN
nr:DUF975 family protein [uncultured Butyrivibrio sp.]